MTRTIAIITAFLGISMFMFGVLKFVDPFKSWYQTQIATSDLPFPAVAYWSGQLGEIVVGAGLLLVLFPIFLQHTRLRRWLFLSGNVLIVIMMLTAFYVHMDPDVPASVLPLKIRPPFIPGIFLVLAMINIYLGNKRLKMV